MKVFIGGGVKGKDWKCNRVNENYERTNEWNKITVEPVKEKIWLKRRINKTRTRKLNERNRVKWEVLGVEKNQKAIELCSKKETNKQRKTHISLRKTEWDRKRRGARERERERETQ